MPIETISRPFVGAPRQESLAQRLSTRLYHNIRGLQKVTTSATSKPDVSPISLVCISDTHNTKPSLLPPGDILLHAGDLSQYGTFAEIQAQLSWITSQPHPHKVVIAGNHDLLLDAAFVADHLDRELDRHPGQRRADLDWGDIHYLERESVDLHIQGKDRSVRVFGSPWTPRCGSWAFQYPSHKSRETPSWDGAVSPDTDILLVHGPPKGHLDDGGKGCDKFLAEVWRVRPSIIVCGHIHPGAGEEWLWFDNAQMWYENAIQEKKPWVSIVFLGVLYFWLLARRAVGLVNKSPSRSQGTHLINAAVVGGRTNKEHGNAAISVVEL